MASLPLVVDLDGTLVHTDMLHETVLRTVRDRPWLLLMAPGWLARGKAFFKRQFATAASVDPRHLPYNEELLHWLREQKRAGRRLVLCTAADRQVADAIARHLGVFDEVMASDGGRNLKGQAKAQALVDRYGLRGFDYVGNSRADLHVWDRARRAVTVNAPPRLARLASDRLEVEKDFPRRPGGLQALAKACRLHQWAKNVLLFVPLVAAHQVFDADSWLRLLLAFLAFSLSASAVYVVNDLLDLESDRAHPRKRHRPFAAGLLPADAGLGLAALLLAAGVGLAAILDGTFIAWLGAYLGLTSLYSWLLKRLLLVDCLALATLYTLRIVAGAAAVQMGLSFWLLAFSFFLFLSLAFIKRYAELALHARAGQDRALGRGYQTGDAPLVQAMGVSSGYGAVLVLALYLNSEAVVRLYRAPETMFAAIPVLLFWISWMWMKAHRGEMHDDPLVFAFKDRVSLVAGALFGLLIVAGALGWALGGPRAA